MDKKPNNLSALIESFVRKLESLPDFRIKSGKMQTMIHYKDVKIGGVNKNHGYITGKIVEGNPAFEKALLALGFAPKSKVNTDGYVQVWWQIPISEVQSIRSAMESACKLIDGGKIG